MLSLESGIVFAPFTINHIIMCRFIFSFLVLISCLNSFGQTINTNSSVVTFSVSNLAINKVKGSFSGMTGTANILPNDLSASKISVCIDANSIDTGNEKRDTHLRTEDFFEVEKYPEICFESSSIDKTSEGYNAKGSLSMHGVSKTVVIPFVFENNQIDGNFEVNRLDYNVGEGTGSFMVGKEIQIQIVCVLN